MDGIVPVSGESNRAMLVPADASKDHRHRLTLYAAWLDITGRHWTRPDLAAYRNALLRDYQGRGGKPLSPNSVSAHLATIRGRYRAILREDTTRDRLYAMTPPDASAADRKAFVDEVVERLRNAIDPHSAPVTVVVKQDVADTEQIRLSGAQASALLNAPGVDTLMGLRDTALLALMLCTGVREQELVNLDVTDLRQRLGGELALLVREGKGAKQRLVPYGELSFALAIVEVWLDWAWITKGAVFRGFYKGGKKVRAGRLHVRAVNQVMERYPVLVDGALRVAHPHDLRRTYARRLYEAGVDLMAIKDNLGHSSVKTTEQYIGTMDVSQRQPPAVYAFDLSRLRR